MVYDLVHCTSHIEGKKLFKSTAWSTFGGKSSTKNTTYSGQLMFDFDKNNNLQCETETDEDCYFIPDIAKYLQTTFEGRENVNYSELWALLDEHPIFPSSVYRNEIKKCLVEDYGAIRKRSSISFRARRI